MAVADAASFARVQSKLEFARLLDELGLPQPAWRAIDEETDLRALSFPYWLKSAFSTAGQGVREVLDEQTRDAAFSELAGRGPLMAQHPAQGQYGQVQGLFAGGRLLAAHTTVQRAVGVGGSAAARLSVDHPLPLAHIAVVGRALGWSGGMTLDYLHSDGEPTYLECNPRTVEPANAAASGVNIPALQVQITLGDIPDGPMQVGKAGTRTHGTIALLLGLAARGEGRRALLAQTIASLTGRGLCADSSEQLTPLIRDPPSAIAAVVVLGRLLGSPRRGVEMAREAVARYSIEPAAADLVLERASQRPGG